MVPTGDYASITGPPNRNTAVWASSGAAGGSPSTLIEFTLRDADGAVELSVRESGWEDVDLEPDRLTANHRDNVEGWELELDLARRAVEGHSAEAPA